MTATADAVDPDANDPPKKSSKLPLLLGLVLALVGGGGGFFAVQSGMIGGGGGPASSDDAELTELPPPAPAAFVAMDPLVINLPPRSGRRYLRFAAQIEVVPEHAAEVEAIRPRIVDVLNSYLRAVEVSDLEDPTALMRLRAQMLRRVQVVAGEGMVRDLLVMEFVLD